MTDPTGAAAITPMGSGGFSVTAAVAETDPDANYQTKTATATKFLTGSEPQESS